MTREYQYKDSANAEAAEHAISLVSESLQRRTALTSELKQKYIKTDNDARLSEAIDQLLAGSLAEVHGSRADGRSLMVIGETGVGKTTSLRRQFRLRKELEPYSDGFGRKTPLVSFEAPSPCAMKEFGRQFLIALGYPAPEHLRSDLIWERVRKQVKAQGVLIVHVDEMQHVFESVRAQEIDVLTNTLKNIMQQSDWPVRFIFSGLPSLAEFKLADAQIWWRTRIIRLAALANGDLALVQHIITMIEEKARLDVSDLQTDEFRGRLRHAVRGALGRLIEFTVDTAVDVLCSDDGRKKLTVADFAKTYRAFAGCDDGDNVFLADRWFNISPFLSDKDEYDEARARKYSRRKA